MFSTLAAVISAATALLGSDPVELGSLDLDIRAAAAEPAVFAVRAYANGPGEEGEEGIALRAEVRLATSIEGGHVFFDDWWQIMGRTFDVRMRCRTDAIFGLERTDMTMNAHGERVTAVVAIEHERATITGDRGETEIPFPAGTVTQSALFRIVPLLPRDAGGTYVFDAYCESINPQVRTPAEGDRFRIVCHGSDVVVHAGADLACTRYAVHVDRDLDFYVDDRSRIVRVVTDGGNTVLSLVDSPATAAVEPD